MPKFKTTASRLDVYVPDKGYSITLLADEEYESKNKAEADALEAAAGVQSVGEKKAPAAKNKKAPTASNK